MYLIQSVETACWRWSGNRQTDTHTHARARTRTQDKYRNPSAHARKDVPNFRMLSNEFEL